MTRISTIRLEDRRPAHNLSFILALAVANREFEAASKLLVRMELTVQFGAERRGARAN